MATIFYLSFSGKHSLEVALEASIISSSLLLMLRVREVLDLMFCFNDLHLNLSEGAADEHLLTLYAVIVSACESQLKVLTFDLAKGKMEVERCLWRRFRLY